MRARVRAPLLELSFSRAALRAALNKVPHLAVCQPHLPFRATDQTGARGFVRWGR